MEEQTKDSLFDYYDWLEAVVFAIVLVVLCFSFAVRMVRVEGESMLQTLHEGDRIFITELAGEPDYGDIVVLNKPNFTSRPFVKRLIAKEGDTVDINFDAGEVSVNGSVLTEDYLNTPTTDYEGVDFPLTVPEGYVFVMGDNRQHSTDSRSTLIGLVDERYVMGKAVLRVYPFNKIGSVG